MPCVLRFWGDTRYGSWMLYVDMLATKTTGGFFFFFSPRCKQKKFGTFYGFTKSEKLEYFKKNKKNNQYTKCLVRGEANGSHAGSGHNNISQTRSIIPNAASVRTCYCVCCSTQMGAASYFHPPEDERVNAKVRTCSAFQVPLKKNFFFKCLWYNNTKVIHVMSLLPPQCSRCFFLLLLNSSFFILFFVFV